MYLRYQRCTLRRIAKAVGAPHFHGGTGDEGLGYLRSQL
ncbi:MAG: hypothetical protein RLZZ611_1148, partial [Cyanobacteriota bacterium]